MKQKRRQEKVAKSGWRQHEGGRRQKRERDKNHKVKSSYCFKENTAQIAELASLGANGHE